MLPKNALNALMCHTKTGCTASRFKQITKLFNDHKKKSLPNREDVDTCLNKTTFLLERLMDSMNSYLQTGGRTPSRTQTGRVRTEASGRSRFSRPPVHWPRGAAPPPLFHLWLLRSAAQYRLGPTPTLRRGGFLDTISMISTRKGLTCGIGFIYVYVAKQLG